MSLLNSDYMNPALFTRHNHNSIRFHRIREGDTLYILTTYRPDNEPSVQLRNQITPENSRNFGLTPIPFS